MRAAVKLLLEYHSSRIASYLDETRRRTMGTPSGYFHDTDSAQIRWPRMALQRPQSNGLPCFAAPDTGGDVHVLAAIVGGVHESTFDFRLTFDRLSIAFRSTFDCLSICAARISADTSALRGSLLHPPGPEGGTSADPSALRGSLLPPPGPEGGTSADPRRFAPVPRLEDPPQPWPGWGAPVAAPNRFAVVTP